MDEIVKIKGGKTGLQLSFAPGASFEAIRKDIEGKLASGSGFFLRGTLVLLPQDRLQKEEQEALQKLFHRNGLICRTMTPKRAADKPVRSGQVSRKAAAGEKPVQPAAAEMTVVNRTLRGGQEILAGGSIDVRGTCRGMVHAGAFGDTQAIIVADHLMPTQIRIANYIARSPDQAEKAEKAERASVKDGHIIIEPIER